MGQVTSDQDVTKMHEDVRKYQNSRTQWTMRVAIDAVPTVVLDEHQKQHDALKLILRMDDPQRFRSPVPWDALYRLGAAFAEMSDLTILQILLDDKENENENVVYWTSVVHHILAGL